MYRRHLLLGFTLAEWRQIKRAAGRRDVAAYARQRLLDATDPSLVRGAVLVTDQGPQTVNPSAAVTTWRMG